MIATSTTASEVITTSSFCSTLPKPVHNEIRRDYIVAALNEYVASGVPLIYVDAPEGYGKSVALSQFVRANPNTTIATFILPSARYTYSIDFLVGEMCRQLHWIMNGSELKDETLHNQSYLSNLFGRFSRRSSRTKEKCVVLVDGLSDIPNGYTDVIREFLPMLSVGSANVTAILSRTSEVEYIDGLRIDARRMTIHALSRAEVREFFSSHKLDDAAFADIYSATQGKPLYLASIIPLLERGVSIEAAARDIPRELRGVFEREWETVDVQSIVLLDLLAVLVLNFANGDAKSVAAVLSSTEEELKEKTKKLSFVVLENDRYSYTSEAYRRYAEEQLKDRMSRAEELIIGSLMKTPDTIQALEELPQFLHRSGKDEDLLHYLTTERLRRVIHVTQSLYPLHQKTDLAIRTAARLGNDDQLLRFSLQKATLSEVKKIQALKTEIGAYLALGHSAQALQIAESCPLKEDRLILYTELGTFFQKTGQPIPTPLASQIRALTAQIDPNILGDDLVEIAASLASCDVGSAVALLNRTRRDGTTSSVLDLALARISVTSGSGREPKPDDTELRKLAAGRIENPGVRGIVGAFRGLMLDLDATGLESQLQSIESAADRLFFLRQWLLANRKDDKALLVVDVALNLLVKSTAIAPNVKMLREIATPLAYAPPSEDVGRLIKRIEAQKGTIEKLGPTEEIVRLEGILVRAEARISVVDGTRRCEAMVELATSQKDRATRVRCISRTLSTVIRCEALGQKQLDTLAARIAKLLKEELGLLLQESADHYVCVAGALEALTPVALDTALEIASSLNLEERRDRAHQTILETLCESDPAKVDTAKVVSIFEAIVDHTSKCAAAAKFLRRWSERARSSESTLAVGQELVSWTMTLTDPEPSCLALCSLLNVISKDPKSEVTNRVSSILGRLDELSSAIEADWDRARVSFLLARDIASVDKAHAALYLERAKRLRESSSIESPGHAETLSACVRMVIRAFAGLVARKEQSEQDIDAIRHLLKQIPSVLFQVGAFSELAVRAYWWAPEITKSITKRDILPLLESAVNLSIEDRTSAIVVAAPALYLFHPGTFHIKVGTLASASREDAYNCTIATLLRKGPCDEAFSAANRHEYSMSSEELLDIAKLVDLLTTDSIIYANIDAVAETATGLEKHKHITRQQMADLANQLRQTIECKLPDKRNIKHEGYKIIADAKVARLLRETDKFWEKLVSSARAVPNIADRCYVMSIVASCLPGRDFSRRKALLEEVFVLIQSIPVDVDRIGRYEILAAEAYDSEPLLSKRCFEAAMNDAKDRSSDDTERMQKDLVDRAYRLSEDLGATLASHLDDDPARRESEEVSNQVKINTLRRKVLDGTEESLGAVKKESPYLVAKACWRLLGEVNAGRCAGIPQKTINQYMQIAATMPVCDAYPIACLVIETLCRRNRKLVGQSWSLRPLFESTIDCARLALWFVKQSESRYREQQEGITRQSDDNSVIVGAGMRTEAAEIIGSWLKDFSKDYLWICDPYFTAADLIHIRDVCIQAPETSVIVFTSVQGRGDFSYDETRHRFTNEWRRLFTGSRADIIIVFHEYGNHESVFHDRWWITNGAGLSIGTSANSIGDSKLSEIKQLSAASAKERECQLEGFVTKRTKFHKGQRIRYESLVLGG